MTLTNTTNTVQEAGNAIKTAYTFDFKIFAAADLKVFEVDQTTLVATQLTITTDYTVAINTTTEGGTVTYVTAPASGKDSFIKREMTIDQQTNVPTEGNIPEDSLNNEYDKSRMIDVQQQEELDRSIKLAETSTLSNIVFPESTSASARATKVPAWDAAGTALELLTPTSIDAVSVIATQGDLVQGSSGGVAEKLAIGSANDVFQVVAGKAAWVTNPTILIPTIADLTGMGHNHSNAAGGGDLTTIQATHLTLTGAAPSTPVADRIYKDSFAKGWVTFQVDGTIDADVNVTTVDDDNVGDWGVNWVTNFAAATYAVVVSVESLANTEAKETAAVDLGGYAAGTTEIVCVDTTDGVTERDPAGVTVVAYGAQ